jgi:alpha-tubulin suppressor-like RCC1 family protein
MTTPTPRRLGLAGLAVAGLAVVLAGGLPTAGASFTGRAASAAQTVKAATLEPLTDTSATYGPDGIAHLSWAAPARSDVAPSYTIRRTIADTTTMVTSGGATAGVSDDLTADPEGFAYKSITELAAGASTTCAVAGGVTYCWGDNINGQIGDGTTTERDVPTPVTATGVLAGKIVTDIGVGYSHVCAVADERAYCWGDGSGLGRGSTASSKVPVAVSTDGLLSGKKVTAISAGLYSTCAIADARAYCWGNNDRGQLGDGTTTTNHLPVAVGGPLADVDVDAISVGWYQTCALAAGQAYCWGYNGGFFDDGTTSNPTPAAVSTVGALAGKTITAIAAGNSNTCAVAAGKAYCWGRGSSGQFGNGGQSDSLVPVAVGAPLAGMTVTAIAIASSGACAVAANTVYCWGWWNSGGPVQSLVPVKVDASGVVSGSTIAAIATGNQYACIAAGGVACVGINSSGQLGDGGSASWQDFPVRAGDNGAGLTVPVCLPDWVLFGQRCAPGARVSISYRVDYTQAGWSPPAPTTLTPTWSGP